MITENLDKYLYRRQYFLGPRPVGLPGNWKTIRISKDYILSFHPDLPVISVRSYDKSIHLLGYIIDSKNPSFDDEQVMHSIIEKSKVADEVFENLADKCGRYVIIVQIGEEFRIFSDACGLRQVFFHVDENRMVWSASQPHLIAAQLGIEINDMIKQDLHKPPLFRSGNYWYPGTVTLFDGVFHLLPNHYLDVHLGQVIRYWPRTKLEPLSMSECVPIVSEILSNIIEGAAYRYHLAFAISSGLDSRTLLSTSRRFAGNILFFTHACPGPIDQSPDVYIPAKMLKDLGLSHYVLIHPEKPADDFKVILEENIFMGRISKGMNALSVFNQFKNENKEVLVIFGNCSEITKRDRFRFPKTPKPLIRGTTLAAMARMSKSKVAKKRIRKMGEPSQKINKV